VVLRYLRLRGELPEHTDHLFVVSRRHQYLGRVALSALLTHEPDADQPADRRRAAGDPRSTRRPSEVAEPVLRPRLDLGAGGR
jgi:hypothetical protein